MTISYPRFTPAERRKLTMSARARESFRTVGIRGGAGPGEGAPPTPPTGDPSYYEMSEDDRALFEAVMNDANSDNPERRAAAVMWWHNALAKILPGIPGGSLLVTGDPNLFERVLSWWGFKTYQGFSLLQHACKTDTAAAAVTAADLSSGAGDQVHLNYKAAYTPTKWECVNSTDPVSGNAAVRFHQDGVNVRVRDEPFSELSIITNHGAVTFYVEGNTADFGGSLFCTPPEDALAASGGGAQEFSNSITTSLLPPNSCIVVEIGTNAGWECSQTVCRGENLTWPLAEPSGSPSPAPFDEPADIPLNPCDMLDGLRDYPYAPPPGTPPGTPPIGTPPVDTPPVDGPPTQPPDPGTNPFPGQPPTDVPTDPGTLPGDPGLPPGDPGLPPTPTVPPGPVVPTAPGTEPIDTGIQDPGAGGCMTLASSPSGFRDPSQAGGIARQYQPGQPMVIDYGENSRCQAKIVKVTPNVGTDGGPEICVGGTIDNGGSTTEKTCYGPGLVTDAIQSVLGDMVAEGGSIIFDSDSTRELYRPLCFRAGTSKRVILNQLLDMVGFCVFPMFDCNVIVGYCGPVNVVWTYHEDVDLIKLDLEYDGQKVYDYVEVFRADFMTQSGNVLAPGNSVLYPVGSPASSVSGDRVYQYEVPYGTPDSELNSIAITLAAKLRTQALPEIAYGVPLNSLLRARHQLRIQMPSVGFDAYYMVTRPARDYDRENGHLSVGLARWLRAA